MNGGAAFHRREERTQLDIAEWIRREFGDDGWEAFGTRFGFDPDLLLVAAKGPIIGSGKSGAGLACTSCAFEIESVPVGRKASREGVWEPCPRCGENALARFYVIPVRRGDIARALFPWTGPKGAKP